MFLNPFVLHESTRSQELASSALAFLGASPVQNQIQMGSLEDHEALLHTKQQFPVVADLRYVFKTFHCSYKH